jgi:hypothetical protein
MTLHGQSTHFTAITQLELSVTTLSPSLYKLTDALQYVLLGKFPINLINPTLLHDIIRNVSFRLPEGIELIAGIRTENIHLYYQFIQTSVVADAHYLNIFYIYL